MPATHTRTLNRFVLNGTLPEMLVVRDTAPPGDATRTYSVVADYGWAEKTLCSGSHLGDANGIALTVGDYLEVPVLMAGPP